MVLVTWELDFTEWVCNSRAKLCYSRGVKLQQGFVVLMVMHKNRQVMLTSFGCCWLSGGAPFRENLGENGGGGEGWWVIAVLLLKKMYVRMTCKICVRG